MATKSKTVTTIPRLKAEYIDKIASELMTELSIKNIHDVPRLQKIVINIGLGRAKDDKKIMEVASNTIRKITGQQPIQTTAKKSIAAFKLRDYPPW
jgi:large subunit ribosomal protein L5